MTDRAPGSRCAIQKKNEVAVASRATMAHFVHILGIVGSFLRKKKKGDAGKPALHETLVQMGKEWEGGRARLKRAEEKNCKCRILLSAAVKSRAIVLVESKFRACQVVKNMVFGKPLRRRLRDGKSKNALL
jgi:hypothetical protein